MSRKKEIDVKDIEILNVIQEDSSISNKDLAERIGLTPGPTLVRVKNLIKNGYIKDRMTQEIDFSKFGYTYNAIVNIAVPSKFGKLLEEKARSVSGIVNMTRLERETREMSKLAYYACYCTFKSEKDFEDAWAGILKNTDYALDFQVWKVSEVVFHNSPIQLSI